MNVTVAPARVEARTVHGAAVRLGKVAKRFQHAGRTTEVLEGIDLDIAPGAFVSIVGASGCGKSTLLRLIAGLERPTAGSVTVAGRPVTGPGPDRGLVFQDHRLFPWLTVAENVELGLKGTPTPRAERRRIVADLVRLVRLEGFEAALPRQLSGGMAQRAAIARALAASPPVLLMDEPFGALDALTRMHLQAELQRIWEERRMTVVLVTHDIGEAVYLSDRIHLMAARPGRIDQVFQVDAIRPRDRLSPDLAAVQSDLLRHLTESDGRGPSSR